MLRWLLVALLMIVVMTTTTLLHLLSVALIVGWLAGLATGAVLWFKLRPKQGRTKIP